jgi:predicted lipid-binding transport protein (Tim44 family)
MKKFLLAALLAVSTMSLVVVDAEARRLGGGGSFGKQSSGVSRQATPPAQNAAAPAASSGAAAAAKPSMMKGLLGGALLGLGLGALLAHLGIGGALASMISTILMLALLGGAGYFIYRMLRGNSARGAQGAGLRPVSASAGAFQSPQIGSHIAPQAQPLAFQAPALEGAGDNLPADFDVAGFVRNAKTYFIRLQAAWDRADVNDLREFTTPEVFAELKLQLQERGASGNHTDVVSLDADVMRVDTRDGEYLVSVRFTGTIKEAEEAVTEPFVEVWNLSKPVSGNGGWLLAGIQQPT